MSEVYRVKPFEKAVDIDVRVPGSKSMTNRALLLAALAEGESVLRGAGMSEDSRVFMEALRTLGFDLDELSDTDGDISIRICGCGGLLPVKKADVYVGSAGTAARFLTAMMGLSDGCYEVTSSDQMKARPMRELLEALEQLGASFSFHEEPYAFPFTVYGRRHTENTGKPLPDEIPLNIDRSSQFLSALLLCGPMVPEGFTIRLTGSREARSYVVITEHMMRQFGYPEANNDSPEQQSHASVQLNQYTIIPSAVYRSRDYRIEPDVSAACYFYAMAAVSGGSARVRGVNRKNTQGDMRFLDVLEQMGCEVTEEKDGDILVSRDPNRPLHGLTVNMSDFSDQTMTLAAVAPFADSPTVITGVSHIRGQESNRILAIVTELTRLGIRCEEREDGVEIRPGTDSSGETLIETYQDHRMAMAFAVLGTGRPGVVIDNPGCCRKTFEQFFTVLDALKSP
ncbi:MAG: 3-phosphoshikimate 1-carboxyvinyltransferase [Eubacterium sp.]|nr:3-phosphoshikimate 1-carboxyvinyltransferase [Eubacterium sp.]